MNALIIIKIKKCQKGRFFNSKTIKIIDEAKNIQEADKNTYVDLYISIPYREITLTCVQIRICQNGEWVETTELRESESSQSVQNKLLKVTKIDAMSATKAKETIANLVPKMVKELMKNLKEYEAAKEKGC